MCWDDVKNLSTEWHSLILRAIYNICVQINTWSVRLGNGDTTYTFVNLSKAMKTIPFVNTDYSLNATMKQQKCIIADIFYATT